MNSSHLNRRHFLQAALTLAAAPCLLPASALGAGGRPAPNNRIGMAVIGLGSRGNDHLGGFMGHPDVQMLAVCDAQRKKAEAAKQRADKHYAQATASGAYKGCSALQDFREILARPDIDAVSIAAPENWHALLSIWAMRAGKDVYCEKALSLTVAEGRAMCDTVRRRARVFQIGTQQRSERGFRFACELARNGYLGSVHTVQVSVPGGTRLPVAQPKPAPPDVDYDLWLGPAPWTPYNDLKCSYNWYFISDYCAGWIQSWGVHHIDIALWGQPALMASTLDIEGAAVFPTEGLANTSVNWNVTCTPAKGPKLVFTDDKGHEHGVRFIGDKGWVHVVRGGIRAEPEELLEVRLKPGDEHLYQSGDHLGNFLVCIRSRRDPVAPVEAGHAATTLTLVCDIATRLQRKLTWDWKTERFLNDAAANVMLGRAMRSPWHI
jgi:hypothetical protein